MRKLGLAAAAALIATPLFALPVQAAPCVAGTEASYEALGAGGCTVGPLTFSNINIVGTALFGGVLGPISVAPFILGNEFGLSLLYTAFAPPGGFVDIAWTYNVSGGPINDAFLALSGSVSGDGILRVDEVLSNGVTLHLTETQLTALAFFDPVSELGVLKDHFQFGGTGSGSFSTSSILTNAFSVVPLPGALPLFITGLGAMGLLSWRRKRKAKAFA
jgi:hypothetical protein